MTGDRSSNRSSPQRSRVSVQPTDAMDHLPVRWHAVMRWLCTYGLHSIRKLPRNYPSKPDSTSSSRTRAPNSAAWRCGLAPTIARELHSPIELCAPACRIAYTSEEWCRQIHTSGHADSESEHLPQASTCMGRNRVHERYI